MSHLLAGCTQIDSFTQNIHQTFLEIPLPPTHTHPRVVPVNVRNVSENHDAYKNPPKSPKIQEHAAAKQQKSWGSDKNQEKSIPSMCCQTIRSRGLEMLLSITKIFHNPFISSLRFSRAPDYLAAIFGGPSLYLI